MAEYIKRKELVNQVIERLSFLWNKYGENDDYSKGYDECVDTILDAPTFNNMQAVIYGHWIKKHNGTYQCSVCGTNAPKMKYCGNCGAKMASKAEVSE